MRDKLVQAYIINLQYVLQNGVTRTKEHTTNDVAKLWLRFSLVAVGYIQNLGLLQVKSHSQC